MKVNMQRGRILTSEESLREAEALIELEVKEDKEKENEKVS